MQLKTKNINILLSVFFLGLISIIYQVVILREFLSIIQGNELIIALIICLWMLFTGLGAKAGAYHKIKKNKHILIYILLILLSILPLISILSLRYLWYYVFFAGQMLNILEIILTVSVVILPFTFISGYLFTLICSTSDNKDTISEYYFVETLGGAIGGILISLVSIHFLNTIETAILLLLVIILTIGIINHHKWFAILITLLLIISGIFLFINGENLDLDSRSDIYPGQKLLENHETPYGNISVTEISNQINIFQAGILETSTNNVMLNEETAHIPMSQRPDAKNILIIGSASPGMLKEIIKYNPNNITLIEQNEYIIDIMQRYFGRIDTIISIKICDPVIALQSAENTYDVVIINSAPPLTAQLNRFYTQEFYNSIKQNLSRDGIIALRMEATENYIGTEASNLQGIVYNTLKSVFKNILLIPAGANHYIASDSELTYNFTQAIENRAIETDYINKFYLDEFSLEFRSKEILNGLNRYAEVNYNFKPVAFYYHIKYMLSFFELNIYWVLAGIAIIFLLAVFKYNLNEITMFSAGFSLSLSEIIIIFVFQVIYGNLYQHIGVIVALFMIGLALGALLIQKISILKKLNISSYLYLMVFCLILLMLSINLTKSISSYTGIVFMILSIVILIISFLTGCIFSKSTQRNKDDVRKSAGKIYSSDLVGSAFGIIVVSAFLIPILGVYNTYLAGIIILLIPIIVFRLKKS
jgi:spermidine synthase